MIVVAGGGMHQVNAGYTVLARLKPERAALASALLVEMNAHPERLPFVDAMTTHFATGAVLPAQRWGDEELPATLLIATSFSGPASHHEAELAAVCGTGLRELFQHCEDFPDPCSESDLAAFLREHRRSDTFYSGMQHLSRADVLRHAELRAAIEEFVDSTPLTGDALSIRRRIQDHVLTRGFAWAKGSFAPGKGAFLALHGRVLVVAILLLALLGGTLAAAIANSTLLNVVVACGWLAVLGFLFALFAMIAGVRVSETTQREVAVRPPDRHVRDLAKTQCHPVINEMTIGGPIKAGFTRPLVMRIALWIVARAAEGIPKLLPPLDIPTVATARWIAADRGRRLVFISNFTNDAEPYVRDFIDTRVGAMRINLSFGFGDHYPITEWLIMRGAVDNPNGFIHVVHQNQHRTELWFCPYKNLTIDNIKLARKIREGLFGDATEAQAKAWLQLL